MASQGERTESVPAMDLFGSRRLVVAANRAPYRPLAGRNGERQWERPAGGLTAALDPVMRRTGGVWVAAQPGEEIVRDVPPEEPSYTVHTLGIDPIHYARYYLGYANSGLWPLAHHMIERARFNPEDFRSYRRVNDRFARAIVAAAKPDDIVWVHDYQLALVPGLLRRMGSALPVAVFWHIPWPALPVLRLCPERKEILADLLGADWIGFQTEEWKEAFIRAARRELKAQVERGEHTVIEYQGRRTIVADVPISVDMDHVEEIARMPVTRERMTTFRRRLNLRDSDTVFLGVDRLDYTKGIPARLEAYDRLLKSSASIRDRVHLIQVAVPSRTEISHYRDLAGVVRDQVRDINRRFARSDRRPITLIEHNMRLDQLVALYRMADVGVVSSLYDGQNLVAKEFVSARVDGDGVLCLSETAGAFQELEAAVPLPPLSPERMAEGLRFAMTMPENERRERMVRLREAVRKNTIYDWLEKVLRGLLAARAA